ncbi:probable inactive leucine-rich repeat receptor-like protein kinase at3g03770 [Phtheirospermum japonicum]|uniref:Probable inactive leucine-rich repeat receptor-like protein kinase at3g03770 n=1 Tax=Phtheirospermum japonicum TaxID=374723 RepID=A0A830C4F9_9LAMI|nr:probable inactive leucine-rich repeat receptor-like protein kinase at3g03770 [Phtheirospermum japonicum]
MKITPRTIMLTLPFFFFFLLLFFNYSNQLHVSQYQALLRIKHQLNFPQELITSRPEQTVDDPCNNPDPTQILTLACYEDDITQLHVIATPTWPSPRLTHHFSTPALFSTIAHLPNLKILSLVSLGLGGPLPPEIGDLSPQLEILNVSSNSFAGPIPVEISALRNLQTLILDHNSFAGYVPAWLSSLTALTVLSLANNSFTGSFPDSFSGMVTLRTLVLSSNNLSGQLPGLEGLTNLQVLDLGNNSLGPTFPTLPKKLVSLVLRMNKFNSQLNFVPSIQLQKLDISSNRLVGLFPNSALSLPTLVYLDVSGNKFTGKLSKNMSCGAQLRFVNLSGNRLTGELPDCLTVTGRVVSYDGNCLSLSGRYMHSQRPLSFCHGEALAVGIDRPRKRAKGPYDKLAVVIGSSGGVVGAMAVVGLMGFLFVKRRHRPANKAPHTRFIVDKVSPGYTLQLLRDARYISETMKLGALGIPAYRTFVLDELKEATSNFTASNLIGEGSYGQVYKGCLTDGSVVAIRSLKVKKRRSIHTYTHHLELFSKLRHCHLVSAIGHCFECYQDDSTVTGIFLVFEFVPNGTLRSFIIPDRQSGQKLTWTQRITAAIGVARGIQFLHTGIVPGVYSNRLKITDILLDNDLRVKISKYSLPLLTENLRLDETEVGREEENDVYDFGVILLEIVVGRPIISSNDVNISKDILSVSLRADSIGRRSIVDPAVHKECSDESLKTVIELCIRCLAKEPSVEDIIWNLQFAAQLQDTWQRDSPAHVRID